MPRTAAEPRSKHVSVEQPTAANVRRKLLKWYDKHQRKLPWRARGGRKPNPYHVLVSEAMLQQTQVATVVPYFEKFVAKWPTVRDLAEADEQAVLRMWQGLGYYRRARNLHATARVIVDGHGGRVPDTVEALIKLPGVGRYTAGAVASIAHNQPAPILDGNVARVLSRLHLIEQPVDAPNVQKELWRLAGELVPTNRPGDFNQAMMELGALTCTKANPACESCPLSRDCLALRAERVSQVPVPAKRKAPTAVDHHVLAIRRNGQYLFQQRPAMGLWSNMWQLPTVEDWDGQADDAKVAGWIKQSFNIDVTIDKCVDPYTHQTTHRTIRFYLWQLNVKSGRLRRGSGLWRRLDALDDLPLANPQRKAVGMLRSAQK